MSYTVYWFLRAVTETTVAQPGLLYVKIASSECSKGSPRGTYSILVAAKLWILVLISEL